MKKITTLLFLICAIYTSAATIIVTNTNDSGAGSFRQAVADASMGDIIRFDPSLIASGSDTIVFAAPVVINEGLFFKGLYNSTDTLFFSGGDASSILNITILNNTSYPHLDFDSLVFINGNGTGGTYGGAIKILNQTTLAQVPKIYLRNCVFRNNTAPFGGAIGSWYDFASTISHTIDIEMYDCTFKSNSATGAGSDGGAIYLFRKKTGATTVQPRIDLMMERCNFLNNESQDQGGAIFMHAENYTGSTYGIANLDITGSTFDSNHTTNAGGAIYINTFDSYAGEVSNSTLEVKTSTFTNNSAVANGGAIYLQSCNHTNVFLYSCTLIGNTALNDGSAIYQKLAGTTVELSNEIILHSNIFLSNNGNSNYNNTIYQSGNVTYFGTDESNICDCAESDWIYYNDVFYDDLFGKTLAEVNLLPLALNSRNTYTMIPDDGSIAIGASNSSGTYDAQNAPILGVRDIGAAESDICYPIPVAESANFCQGTTYDFYGQILTSAGNYTHTIVTPAACDTIVTLTLTEETPAIPTINITANPGNTIMIGTPVTITATVTNGGTAPSFQWYANGNPIGPNASSVITSTLTDGSTVYCVLTSNDACVNPSSVQSATITFTVHSNNDEPCNAIALDVNTSCVTEYFANHIATATTNVGPHSCASSTSRDIWFSFSAPSSGNVHIYTYAGTLLDAVMSVYLGPNCSSLFEAGCIDDDGANQMPQGMVTGAVPDTTYYIRVSSYGTTASGNFGICVVDPGINGLTENKSNNFELYPNPSTGIFKVNFNSDEEKSIKIYNALGAIIYQEKLKIKVHTFNLSHFENGIYFIEVEEDGSKVNQKIIIEQ